MPVILANMKTEPTGIEPFTFSTGGDADSASYSPAPACLIRLGEASRLPWMPRRNGKVIHTKSLERWCHRGIRGIRLWSACVGRTRVTTEAALREFFDRLGQAPQPAEIPQPRRLSREAQSAAHRVKEILGSSPRRQQID